MKKSLKIIFGLILAVILGWFISAIVAFGIHSLITGKTTSRNNNIVSEADLITIKINDSSDKKVSLPAQTPFTLSWRADDSLSSSECTLVGFVDMTGERERVVEHSGSLTITSPKSGGNFYTLKCTSGSKLYSKLVEVDIK